MPSTTDVVHTHGKKHELVNADDAGRSKKTKHDLVQNVSNLSTEEYNSRYIDAQWLSLGAADPATRHTLTHHSSNTMTADGFEQCFNLVAATSKADYENSSLGWKPVHKRREMRDADMHYILVHRANKSHGETSADDVGLMQGFLSYMVTYECSPPVPVLYIYEIHLAQSSRGIGLGKKLISLAYQIAASIGLEKVMLTCFLSNQSALAFYRGQRFERDACSPEDRKIRKKIVRVDYVIMSRLVVDAEQEKPFGVE